MSLSYDSLLLLGIDSLAEIELGFAVSDEDYNTTYTGPRQILTSEAAGYEPNPNSYQEAVGSAGVLEASASRFRGIRPEISAAAPV